MKYTVLNCRMIWSVFFVFCFVNGQNIVHAMHGFLEPLSPQRQRSGSNSSSSRTSGETSPGSSKNNSDGLLKLVKQAIKHEEWYKKDKYGHPCIFVCAEHGYVAELNTFLDAGVDVNYKDVYGRTLLFAAASKGKNDVVSLLLKRNADPHISILRDWPIDFALSNGHYSVVRLLQEHCDECRLRSRLPGAAAINHKEL
jgi:ankyrin repeat protein